MPSYNMYKGHMDKDSRAGGLNVGKGVGWSGGSNGGENRNNCKLITIKNRKKKKYQPILSGRLVFFMKSLSLEWERSLCVSIFQIFSPTSQLFTQ